MRSEAAEVELLDTCSIRGPKNGTDVVETSDVVKDNNDGMSFVG